MNLISCGQARGEVRNVMLTRDPASRRPAKRRRTRTRAGRPDINHRLKDVRIILDVATRISGTESLEEVLGALVEMTSVAINCDRVTFFLHDPGSGELYSRVALGLRQREIRLPDNDGIVGVTFQTGDRIIVDDAYADPRFNPKTDQDTGYNTKTVLSVPLRTAKGEIIGVAQALNKRDGPFGKRDQVLLEGIAAQSVPALKSSQIVERMQKARAQELAFLDIVADITSQLDLDQLLQRVMAEATRILGAERSTLFLHDEKTGELFSRIAMGAKMNEIRFPNHAGIAGAVFITGKTVNIPHAYADLRFNPAFDRQTGFFTRSILCTPVINKQGKIIGVTQVLNKSGGAFSPEDESRLKAFTAQVAIALENAKLFDDVQKIKNYNESMLESMSNGVLTLDETDTIVTCNTAGARILRQPFPEIIGRTAQEFFGGQNTWIIERIAKVRSDRTAHLAMDVELAFGERPISVNLTVLPLASGEGQQLGTLLMIEDISAEKRVKATMARYMDPAIAARMLDNSSDTSLLGGASTRATVLFSDIRDFTALAEALGAQGTVAFLNEYFALMVECISREAGMLDKFIGDAIMAAFGLPVAHEDDEDRAVRAAIAMLRECRRFSAERVKRGQRPVEMGVGLNTDMVVSGNIGSAKRMDYTIIGDGVNLASRLESACKLYSAQILLSEHTVARLRGIYRVRNIDQVIVKGKSEPVSVYEVLDHHTDDTFPNIMDVVSYFNDGIQHYRAGHFEKAIGQFRKALECNPNDKLFALYIERCQYLCKHPPGESWNGVWVMTHK
jgi:adenylate cyclase